MARNPEILELISRINRAAAQYTDLLNMQNSDFPIRAFTLYRGIGAHRVMIGHIKSPHNSIIRLFYSASIPYGVQSYEIDDELLEKARDFFGNVLLLANSANPEFNVLEYILAVSCIDDIEWGPPKIQGAS